VKPLSLVKHHTYGLGRVLVITDDDVVVMFYKGHFSRTVDKKSIEVVGNDSAQ